MRLPRCLVFTVLSRCSLQPALAHQTGEAPAANQWDASLAFRFLTLGLGVEAAKLLVDMLAARAGANFFSWSTTHAQTGISYDATIKLHPVSLPIDFYPHTRATFPLTPGMTPPPS